jgi:hypothetical protein
MTENTSDSKGCEIVKLYVGDEEVCFNTPKSILQGYDYFVPIQTEYYFSFSETAEFEILLDWLHGEPLP